MFGIDFPELVVVAIVALIVIGPEHLPKVARTIGHLWGRGQRYVNGIKSDISRDMALDELRQMQQKMQQEASSLEQSMSSASQELQQQVNEVEGDIAKPEMSTHEIPRHEIIEEQQPALQPQRLSINEHRTPDEYQSKYYCPPDRVA